MHDTRAHGTLHYVGCARAVCHTHEVGVEAGVVAWCTTIRYSRRVYPCARGNLATLAATSAEVVARRKRRRRRSINPINLLIYRTSSVAPGITRRARAALRCCYASRRSYGCVVVRFLRAAETRSAVARL